MIVRSDVAIPTPPKVERPEPCEKCDGTGLMILGEIPASWSSPAEYLTDTCDRCGGKETR